MRNLPCAELAEERGLALCRVGVPRRQARATVALVGDSHAAHWRAALNAVAHARRWHVIEMTHTACPLSTAVRALPDPERFARCARFKRQVFAWFARHRDEVDTVFAGGLSGGTGVLPRRGRGRFRSAVDGYVAGWRRVLRSVRRIVAFADTPKTHEPASGCIDLALALGNEPGRACATSRRFALDRDPILAAVRRIDSPRVRAIDLTHVFCAPDRCFPVVGGALVTRDTTHLTATFSATLAPLLLREVDRLAEQRAASPRRSRLRREAT
jgi:hypothetical protein